MKAMLFIALIAGFVVAQLPSTDGWPLVAASTTKPRTYYFYKHDSLVLLSDRIIKFWLRVYKDGDRHDTYRMELVYANCSAQQFSTLQQHYYKDGKRDTKLGFTAEKPEWLDVMPGTISEGILDAMCERARFAKMPKPDGE